MHMIIKVIVEADNKEAALDNAKGVFDELCGEGEAFDYYTTFDEEGSLSSGKGRWGAIPPVVNVNSKKGKQMLAEGIQQTKDEFFENLKIIREALLCCTDEEIFEGEILCDKTKITGVLTGSIEDLKDAVHLARYRMHCCGAYDGPSIRLYDKDGGGIRTQSYLDCALSNLLPGQGWVVPADVHF